MSERFLKYIPSTEALWLKQNHPWAFLLLTTIAERARRIPNLPDGLNIGEAHIGDHNAFGSTRQQYRTALKVLTDRLHVKTIESCRTRQKSTTGSTTIGTKVKLLSSSVYDINLEVDNQQSNHRPTTDQPPTNHEQERTKNEKKEEQQQNKDPSDKIISMPTSDNVCSDVVFSCLERIGFNQQDQISISKILRDEGYDEKSVNDEVMHIKTSVKIEQIDNLPGFLISCVRKKSSLNAKKKNISPHEFIKNNFKHDAMYNCARCIIEKGKLAFERGMKNEYIEINKFCSYQKLYDLLEFFDIKEVMKKIEDMGVIEKHPMVNGL